ncbi:MAG: polyprenyl synthetase family protein [Kiritimatiellae bacterium]|nr:polyprenyl synthetase family protein [Kiritimatiellia bacterium]
MPKRENRLVLCGQDRDDGNMFDLTMYLEEKRIEVDKALDQCLPSAELEPCVLHEAMRYSVFSGGKRLRPVLCMAAAETIASSCTEAMPPALAVELLHTYTLIHDDLPCMDNDDERRGKPTCHIKFGEANAILAGDSLQALAFEVLVRQVRPDIGVRLVAELGSAAGSLGVVGGQVVDIAMTGEPLDSMTLDFIHQHKTADLFCAAIRMGAMVADASDKQLDALTRYARSLGVAFQMIDDILDACDADPSQTIEESSCITVLGIDEACRRAQQLTETAIDALRELGASEGPLAALARHMAERQI